MRIAAVQFDIKWEDKPANHRTVQAMLEAARIAPGTFVLLPELADTGFSMHVEKIVDNLSIDWGRQLAKRMQIWLQHGFARIGEDGRGRNCAAIIDPTGELSAVYEKVHPFSYGKEAQHYSGGAKVILRQCGGVPNQAAATQNENLPAAVCPLICYDLRFPELWRIAALAGAEVFTIGANWPQARQAHWRALITARAIENQAFVVGVNRIGDDPHLHYQGGSIIVSPRGEVLAEAKDGTDVLTAELDIASLRQWRREFPALRDIHRELLGSFSIDSTI